MKTKRSQAPVNMAPPTLNKRIFTGKVFGLIDENRYGELCRNEGLLDGASIPRLAAGKLYQSYLDLHTNRAKRYGEEIKESHLKLNAIISKHGGKIYKSWREKDRQQRIDLLKKVKSYISTQHSPDLGLYRAFSNGVQLGEENVFTYRRALLMPYINTEDLSRASTLPLFMNTRAFAQPYEFVTADYQSFKSVQEEWIGGTVESKKHSIWLGKEPEVSEDFKDAEVLKHMKYGNMVSFDDVPGAKVWEDRGLGLNSRSGMLVLEKQRKTYEFLVDCCQEILPDEDLKDCEMSGGMLESTFQIPADAEDEIPKSIKDHIEAPYRQPTPASLTAVHASLIAMFEEAEDHLRLLREDPEYFLATMQEEYLGDKSNNDLKIRSSNYLNDAKVFEKVLKAVFSKAFKSLRQWGELRNIAKTALEHMEKDTGDAADSVSTLDICLTMVGADFTYDLLDCFYDTTQVMRQDPSETTDTNQQNFQLLIKLLQREGENENLAKKLGVSRMSRELHRIVMTEKMAKHVSAAFARKLGDMSIIGNLTDEVARTQPADKTYNPHELYKYVNEYLQRILSKYQSFDVLVKNWHLDDNLIQKCLPTEAYFGSSEEQSGSQETVPRIRSAEELLNEIWLKFDDCTWESQPFRENLVRVNQPFFPEKTPAWIEQTAEDDTQATIERAEEEPKHVKATETEDLQATEAKEIEAAGLETGEAEQLADVNPEEHEGAGAAVRDDVVPEPEQDEQNKPSPKESSAEPFSEENSHLPAELPSAERWTPGGRYIGPKPREKKKTRGAPAELGDPEPLPAPAPAPAPRPTIKVNRRAYNSFMVLFSRDRQQGRKVLDFEDLQHAMSSVGFVVNNSAAGSACQFTPGPGVDFDSISIHRPHPDSKIRHHIIQRVAYRLWWRFGWGADTFVEEEKS